MHIGTAFRSGFSISGVTAPAALALVCVCAGAWPASAQPAPAESKAASLAPTDPWNTLSADITLRRSRVDAAGQPVGDGVTAQRYHWERSSATGHWKTTMTLAPASPLSLRTLSGTAPVDDRLMVARIEDNEDGSGPRIFNKRGDMLRAPGTLDQLLPARPDGDPARFPPPPASNAAHGRPQATQSVSQWIDNHFLKRNGHGARRLAFQRRHGPPVGQVRGLDRYVSTHGDRTVETLVDRQLQVPIEANVVRQGQLVSHRTMSYAPAGGDFVVRRSLRTERLVSSKTGERAIVEIEFANVRLEQRR